jgi:hypothetical protein
MARSRIVRLISLPLVLLPAVEPVAQSPGESPLGRQIERRLDAVRAYRGYSGGDVLRELDRARQDSMRLRLRSPRDFDAGRLERRRERLEHESLEVSRDRVRIERPEINTRREPRVGSSVPPLREQSEVELPKTTDVDSLVRGIDPSIGRAAAYRLVLIERDLARAEALALRDASGAMRIADRASDELEELVRRYGDRIGQGHPAIAALEARLRSLHARAGAG